MSIKYCPFCDKPLKQQTGVEFTEAFGLTDSELLLCRCKGIRWDCESCNIAWLFFSKKKWYFWDRNTINDGFSRGWQILTLTMIRQHLAPVKVLFT